MAVLCFDDGLADTRLALFRATAAVRAAGAARASAGSVCIGCAGRPRVARRRIDLADIAGTEIAQRVIDRQEGVLQVATGK